MGAPVMIASRFSRLCALALATPLGSGGVFFVWASFAVPWAGAHALVCLGAATALITLTEGT